MEILKIQKYLSEFHDGSLINIEYIGQNCTFSLESAEMVHAEMKNEIMLSERGAIKGKFNQYKLTMLDFMVD